jgi:hypothetical protein
MRTVFESDLILMSPQFAQRVLEPGHQTLQIASENQCPVTPIQQLSLVQHGAAAFFGACSMDVCPKNW